MKSYFVDTLVRVRIPSLALAVLMTLALSTTAMAQDEPSEQEIMGAKTVVVQPVLVTGLSPDAEWAAVGAFFDIASAKDAKSTYASAGVPNPSAGKGFGFAGSSTPEDVRVLHFAFKLGTMTAAIKTGNTAAAAKLHKELRQAQGDIANLAEPLRKAASQILSYAGKGRIDGASLAAALRAAQDGIADPGPERAHGYFLAGLWSGLSVLAALSSGVSDTFVGMAGPIVQLLEEDAKFGGSDRQIARQIMTVARELKKPQNRDLKVIVPALTSLLKVKAD